MKSKKYNWKISIIKATLFAVVAIVCTGCPLCCPPEKSHIVTFLKFKNPEYSKYVVGYIKQSTGEARINAGFVKDKDLWWGWGVDSCSLVSVEKYIPLHQDYMLCRPYIIQYSMVFDLLWEDVCAKPLRDVAIKDSSAYAELWSVTEEIMCEILSVEKIKSVEQMKQAINTIIDENKINDLCTKAYFPNIVN